MKKRTFQIKVLKIYFYHFTTLNHYDYCNKKMTLNFIRN